MDLIRQVDLLLSNSLKNTLPEWVGYENCFAHIGLIYVRTLRDKYDFRNNIKQKKWLTKLLRGSLVLPDWYSHPVLNENQQAYLKWLGLARLFHYQNNRIPGPKDDLTKLVPPEGTHADYSHFEVEPNPQVLKYASVSDKE